MKIVLESTTKVVELVGTPGDAGVPARIWEGHTEAGVPVYCYVTRIAVRASEDQDAFERELRECRPPSPDVAAIPFRMVL